MLSLFYTRPMKPRSIIFVAALAALISTIDVVTIAQPTDPRILRIEPFISTTPLEDDEKAVFGVAVYNRLDVRADFLGD